MEHGAKRGERHLWRHPAPYARRRSPAIGLIGEETAGVAPPHHLMLPLKVKDLASARVVVADLRRLNLQAGQHMLHVTSHITKLQ